MLLDHAIIIPYSISAGDGYVISNLNPLEGEFASYGVARERYKYQKLYDTSMSMEEFNTAFDAWEAERTKAIAQ